MAWDGILRPLVETCPWVVRVRFAQVEIPVFVVEDSDGSTYDDEEWRPLLLQCGSNLAQKATHKL